MEIILIAISAILLLLSIALVITLQAQKSNSKRLAEERDTLERRLTDNQSEIHRLLQQSSEATSRAKSLEQSLQQLRSESSRSIENNEQTIRELIKQKSEAAARAEALEERLALQQQEQAKGEERLKEQFKSLAGEIFSEQSREFKSTNSESLSILLKPFKENIKEFRERVEQIYSADTEQRGALKNELRNLMELNKKITSETTNLTNALKGNSKVQGDWGEMILETILDNSNLIKGVHYDTQHNIKDEQGNNLRPDVVLYLPENKQIVIDSKTSLTAYAAFASAESEAERRVHLASHLTSVRQHVVELGRKEYQKLLNSPDFVIMFIPNEPAFLAALQADSSIWSDAYDKKVIISSPTNLFALLKLVDDLWKRNAQSKNTESIVTYGTKMYDQLVAFTNSLEGVGLALDSAKDKYNDAYKRLCTGNDNLIRNGERLRKLGLPTKKSQSAKALEGNQVDEDAESLIAQ